MYQGLNQSKYLLESSPPILANKTELKKIEINIIFFKVDKFLKLKKKLSLNFLVNIFAMKIKNNEPKAK
tara:strand:+ start:61 stop:267 length:207 start_codon:yes stop_codon:yes gene_type:complete